MRVLFVSYDGVLEPLGQSQVLPYVLGLTRYGVCMHLLSFEKATDLNLTVVRQLRARLEAAGVGWTLLRYHKRLTLLAAAFDVFHGVLKGAAVVSREGVGLVHARSYVGAVIALLLKGWFGVRFLFDMREFWVDGKVEGGSWRRGGLLYRLGKRWERRFLREADAIVSLTHRGRAILESVPEVQTREVPISVIPTCTDLALFRPAETSANGSFVLVYLGSVGTWYMLEEMVAFFLALREEERRWIFRILTPAPVEDVRRTAARAGAPLDLVEVRRVSYEQVPHWLATARASLFLIRPTFAKLSSCPTKLAESLACGVPVVANPGVGDVEEVLTGYRVGVLVREFSRDAYRSAARELLALLAEGGSLRERCRATAETLFSLERAVKAYFGLYAALTE